VNVPEQRTSTYSVCVCDNVPETKTESYVVRVPKKVTKKICVKVPRCVEVEVPAGNGGSNGCGGARKGLGLGCKKGC
jgi:hypothetical protein